MSLFIVGILVGWLAEWLFFTFWVSKEESKNDCSDLESVLQAKNIEISALKAEIKKTTTVSEINSKTTAAKSSDGKTTSAEKKKETVKKVPKSVTKAETKSTDNEANPESIAKKKVTAEKKVNKSKFANGDDFTKLSGIGPSMTNMMHEIGITTYKKLADMDDDILRTMLEAAGARLNSNKEAMDSWNEQATLADKGDFAGLKKFQEELKNK